MEGSIIHKQNVLLRIFTLTWLSKSTILEIISMLLMIFLLYTGVSKWMEYAAFKEQIAHSPILQPIAPLIALALTLTEFPFTILLIIPPLAAERVIPIAILMITSSGYVGAIKSFDKEFSSSCGIISLLSWRDHLILISALVLPKFIGVNWSVHHRGSRK